MTQPSNAPAAAMIEVQDLYKRYGREPALRGLSLRVPEGSIYGFVGPNGAGKTTTIRILATLLRPDQGNGWIAGQDVRKHPERVRGRLGYMPDFFGLYEDLTVVEYLDFYGRSYGLSAAARARTIRDLLELVDLTPKRDHLVEGLSRGMKQRLGLARCLVHDPQVLLLDEPASGMDPRARYELREIVRELRRLGKTVVISSHILLELAEMCTHIGIIQDGRLLREGPVQDVLQHGRIVAVRILDTPARAAALLQGVPEVSSIQVESLDGLSVVSFRTTGDERQQSELLRLLVQSGIPVLSFSHQQDNLEDVFMQLTADPGEIAP